MVVDLCVCEAVRPIDTETRVVLVVHRLEWQKTTNTSVLLSRVLKNSEVRIRADRARSFSGDDLADAVVLYPSDDAVPLASLPEPPSTLVVPDGTWRQARKALTREPSLADLPRVRLPEGSPSRYFVRKNVRGDAALSTAEAVARALAILEGEVVAQAVLAPFELMVSRTMRLRGRSTDDEHARDA